MFKKLETLSLSDKKKGQKASLWWSQEGPIVLENHNNTQSHLVRMRTLRINIDIVTPNQMPK